jgi:hypothetical protein
MVRALNRQSQDLIRIFLCMIELASQRVRTLYTELLTLNWQNATTIAWGLVESLKNKGLAGDGRASDRGEKSPSPRNARLA